MSDTLINGSITISPKSDNLQYDTPASQQPTFLFSIYQNKTWTIRHLVNETIDPATQRIILKIVGFHEAQT